MPCKDPYQDEWRKLTVLIAAMAAVVAVIAVVAQLMDRPADPCPQCYVEPE